MKMTVYTTNTCGYCHMLKSWLDEFKVPYTEYKVDENPIAADNMIRLSGQRGVPFTVVEKNDGSEEHILGFDRNRFQSLLWGI